MWVQGEETEDENIDVEARKRIIVPESSDVNWDIDLEIIVTTSTVCALITKVIVHVAGPTKSLHTIITPICAVPEGWVETTQKGSSDSGE